jgi:hypothetical protein
MRWWSENPEDDRRRFRYRREPHLSRGGAVATEGNSPSFWVTLPGILTAVAGLITAVTGLLVVLNQIGNGDVERAKDAPTTDAPTSAQSPSSGNGNAAEGDALAGTWTGTAAQPNGDNLFRVRLDIASPCQLRKPCGTISVSSAPCRGQVTLWAVRAETYELYVGNFTDDSSPDCTPGAGDFFELVDGGTLRYTTGYADIQGVLHKVG